MNTEAKKKKKKAEKSSLNNQVYCSQRKLSLFHTRPQSSAWPCLVLVTKMKEKGHSLFLALYLVERNSGPLNLEYGYGPITFPHQSLHCTWRYILPHPFFFLHHCKNLKSYQNHQPFPTSHTSPKPSSIMPLSERNLLSRNRGSAAPQHSVN